MKVGKNENINRRCEERSGCIALRLTVSFALVSSTTLPHYRRVFFNFVLIKHICQSIVLPKMAIIHSLPCAPQSTEELFRKFRQEQVSLFDLFESEGTFSNPPNVEIVTQPLVVSSELFSRETIKTVQTQTHTKGILEVYCSYFFYTLKDEKTSQHLQIGMTKVPPGVILFDASADEKPGRLVTELRLSESHFVSESVFARLKQFFEKLLAPSTQPQHPRL